MSSTEFTSMESSKESDYEDFRNDRKTRISKKCVVISILIFVIFCSFLFSLLFSIIIYFRIQRSEISKEFEVISLRLCNNDHFYCVENRKSTHLPGYEGDGFIIPPLKTKSNIHQFNKQRDKAIHIFYEKSKYSSPLSFIGKSTYTEEEIFKNTTKITIEMLDKPTPIEDQFKVDKWVCVYDCVHPDTDESIERRMGIETEIYMQAVMECNFVTEDKTACPSNYIVKPKDLEVLEKPREWWEQDYGAPYSVELKDYDPEKDPDAKAWKDMDNDLAIYMADREDDDDDSGIKWDDFDDDEDENDENGEKNDDDDNEYKKYMNE